MKQFKILLFISILFAQFSYGQTTKSKSKKTVAKKVTTPTKAETVKWILEKLNTYSLNDIVIKCGDGNLYNDKYSNFLAKYNETSNEFIIHYKVTNLNDNSSLYWTRTIKATDFKDIKDYADQPGTQGCTDRRLIAINSNCKCIKEQSGSSIDNQITLTTKTDYIFIRFDSSGETDLLKRMTKAFETLISIIQNPKNQTF